MGQSTIHTFFTLHSTKKSNSGLGMEKHTHVKLLELIKTVKNRGREQWKCIEELE